MHHNGIAYSREDWSSAKFTTRSSTKLLQLNRSHGSSWRLLGENQTSVALVTITFEPMHWSATSLTASLYLPRNEHIRAFLNALRNYLSQMCSREAEKRHCKHVWGKVSSWKRNLPVYPKWCKLLWGPRYVKKPSAGEPTFGGERKGEALWHDWVYHDVAWQQEQLRRLLNMSMKLSVPH